MQCEVLQKRYTKGMFLSLQSYVYFMGVRKRFQFLEPLITKIGVGTAAPFS